MKITKILLASSMLIASFGAFAQGKPSAYTEKDLVWKEDFNGKKLNTKDWNYEFHEPGWVNAELQSYGDSKKNTYVKDGCLVIQALQTKYKDGTASYTSGRINTQGKHAFTYGRFEAKIRVPKGKGFLPAFWMMPDDESYYGQWPKCGEIDIMEVMGHETNKLYGTIHYGEPHAMSQLEKVLEKGNFADEFHVFAVEWEPGEIRWYCDGENYHTANNWFTKRSGFGEVTYPAPFDQPFYIILNVAVGGSWVGYPDETTDFDPKKDDAKMFVDYVKVYQKKEYNEDVEPPAKAPVVAKADSSGNLASINKDDWKFLTAAGGAGSVESDGKSHTIKSTSEGSVDYAVQYVLPKIALNRGFKYRYSFDASAEEARTIRTGISAPDFNYTRRFGDVKVELTPKTQHYSWEFVMSADSDANCRIEYNCGAQNSKATVKISNVRLEKIGEADLGDSGCLPDGNYIVNGQFQEGKGRLGGWEVVNNANAAVSVSKTRARMLQVVSPKGTKADGVIAKQKGIKLDEGGRYVVKMEAWASKAAVVSVKLGDVVKEFKVAAGEPEGKKAAKATKCEFVYASKSAAPVDFEILAGSDDATVWIDNVSLKENAVVVNGSFEKDMSGWEVYAHENADCSCEIVNEGGNKQAVLTIDKTGNQDWQIQLKQNGCLLEKDKFYRISLKAKCDIDRSIMLALQRDGSKDNNWVPYSDTLKFGVGPELKDYSWEFQMKYNTDPKVIFTISMGSVNGKMINKNHHVTIDSIVVEEIDALTEKK